MAGEAGLLDGEPHLLSIGSDFYVLDELTERRNVFLSSVALNAKTF
jgi:hypothetical protein